jgi:hypothetical protein
MKTLPCLLGILFVLNFGFNHSLAAPPTAAEPGRRMNIELRDGSRVVGQSVDETLKFQSQLLGGLKLNLKELRSIDCLTTNSATLTTTNGDTLAVWFAGSELRVSTKFGKVELPVKLIRRVQISPTGPVGQLPSGLVSLWSGEGDGNDSAGSNPATLTDISFADGKVGQAFSFNGTSSHFEIPESPALNVGEGEGLTISAWIKPSDVNGLHPILEWQPGGVQFWIGQNPGSQGVLCGYFMDNSGADNNENHYVQIPSPRGTLVANTWQHIAVTYSKNSGVIGLYVNGTMVSQRQWGSYVPLTKGRISSFRPSNPGDWTYNRFFAGLMDELAIYNRALSASEIQAICTEQNHGEPLPTLRTFPSNGRFYPGGIINE